MLTANSVQWFVMYFLSGAAMLALFARMYIFVTPYNERVHIEQGKLAPAVALVGAMLGFTIPIVSMSYHGAHFVEYLVWSVLAGVVQLVSFRVLYRVLPMRGEADNAAAATVYAGSAVCIGVINAFSLIP